VRNIQQDPSVRVRLRVGLRYRWVPGFATVLPDDDPLARQRRIIRWHPLRAFNAINVRVLGADLLTVHVRLMPDGSSGHTATSTRHARDTSNRGADCDGQQQVSHKLGQDPAARAYRRRETATR
jgi:hypothetical protein